MEKQLFFRVASVQLNYCIQKSNIKSRHTIDMKNYMN